MPAPEHTIQQLPADGIGVFGPPQNNQSTRQTRKVITAWPNHARAPKLLDKVRLSIRARHYSERTEESYVHWIERFILFHNKRHPAEMGEPEINAYLTHLALQEHVSSSTQNQALAALLFLYRDVLGRELGELGDVIRARRPKRSPIVLTREEVKAVLSQLHGDKWLMASLMYGAGLRLMPACRRQGMPAAARARR